MCKAYSGTYDELARKNHEQNMFRHLWLVKEMWARPCPIELEDNLCIVRCLLCKYNMWSWVTTTGRLTVQNLWTMRNELQLVQVAQYSMANPRSYDASWKTVQYRWYSTVLWWSWHGHMVDFLSCMGRQKRII